jgi:hypothetical protein
MEKTEQLAEQQGQGNPASSTKPLPKIWIGFVIALVVFVAEVADASMGLEGRFGFGRLFTICGVTYWLFCLYRIHYILRDISGKTYPVTPSAAWGLHFVPIFNLYWVFRWPMRLVTFLKGKGVRVIPGWIMGVVLLLSLLVVSQWERAIFIALFFLVVWYVTSRLREVLGQEPAFGDKPIIENAPI